MSSWFDRDTNGLRHRQRPIGAGSAQASSPVRGLAGEGGELGFPVSAEKLPDVASCLILDIRRLSGLDFQADLAAPGIHVPIIVITGHGDIPMSVKAMKAGAIDVLSKPFRDQEYCTR
jgi:DNA-binding NarL/FixJ family response regulator